MTQLSPSRPEPSRRQLALAVLGAILLWAILAIPAGIALPLEWPLALAAVALVRGPVGWVMRRLFVTLAAILLFLALADRGTQAAFARPFNPILDLHLFVSGWHLLSGSVGIAASLGFVAVSLVVFVVVLAGLGRGFSALSRLPAPIRLRAGLAALAVAGLGLAVADRTPFAIGFEASRAAERRIVALGEATADLAAFENDLVAGEPLPPGPGPASVLAGKDVLVLFVESYGRSALDDPRYGPTIRARLANADAEMTRAGFSSISGWLGSPTVGGQSWLAHGTLLSGLRVDSQRRYDRLMASRRDSLNDRFREAGWRTVAVMPAITMAWPEAAWYGYDVIYDRDALGYRGDPFNWVTMPDQYTLAALQRLELGAGDRAPVMAEVALISSHAPWTPIPPLLPWESVGDGTVFSPYAAMGDPPEVVWGDPERIRAQYLLAVDYALETVASFIATQAGRDTVLVILGDHQPAPVVTGEGVSRDVPVHIVARDPAVIAALAGLGYTVGLVPGPDVRSQPMESFAPAFLDAVR